MSAKVEQLFPGTAIPDRFKDVGAAHARKGEGGVRFSVVKGAKTKGGERTYIGAFYIGREVYASHGWAVGKSNIWVGYDRETGCFLLLPASEGPPGGKTHTLTKGADGSSAVARIQFPIPPGLGLPEGNLPIRRVVHARAWTPGGIVVSSGLDPQGNPAQDGAK